MSDVTQPPPVSEAAQPRHLIFTFYGTFRQQVDGWVAIAHLISMMDVLGVDAQSVRSAISRLKRRGLLESHRIAGAAGYSISAEAQRVLIDGDSRIFGRVKPALEDGWVVAVFSVPEVERDKRHLLRSRLYRIGFGSVAPGVWIAPHHLRDDTIKAIEPLGLAEHVDLFSARYEAFGSIASMVSRWWDLDSLATTYEEFCSIHEPVLQRWSRRRGGDDATAFADYMRAVDHWRRLTFLDPHLPAELLPPRWVGARAEHTFFGLHRILRERAQDYVRVATST